LLILALLALFATSGVVWAGATVSNGTWAEILTAITDPGTTWTEGGMTHLRDAVLELMVLRDYDADGNWDEVTTVVGVLNYTRDANGAGPHWGTWSEYDYATGTELLGGGPFQGMLTCWEGQDVEEEYAFGLDNVVGWHLRPNGDWGQIKGTGVMYSVPMDDPPYYYVEFRGEFRFLVPGGP
jgi:hypothetical protein